MKNPRRRGRGMGAVLRSAWDGLSIYLPVLLMGLFALSSWWLVRSVPGLSEVASAKPVRHEPDYFMSQFSLKSFAANGQLKSEIIGVRADHFPVTDLLEIEQVRIRSIGENGLPTIATARRALSNADGSDLELHGNALVVREASRSASNALLPRLEFRGEFLRAQRNAHRLESHLPVTLSRGSDQFTADAMNYDEQGQVLNLVGRVRAVLAPRGKP